MMKNSYLSHTFKLWVVGIIFSLIVILLYNDIVYPNTEIIPKELILGVVLALVVYLWAQELTDRYHLQAVNRALEEAQQKLQEAQIDTITVLVRTQEAKDPYAYALREYAAKPEELDRFDARMKTEIDADRLAGKLREFTGNWEKDLED